MFIRLFDLYKNLKSYLIFGFGFYYYSSGKCVRRRCSIMNTNCLNLPLSISHNYIAFSSGFSAPAVLFKIATVPDRRFSYRFKFLSGNEGGEFALMQSDYVATVNVMRSVEGPKEFNLKVEMEVYQKGILAARYVSKILFNVSEFSFWEGENLGNLISIICVFVLDEYTKEKAALCFIYFWICTKSFGNWDDFSNLGWFIYLHIINFFFKDLLVILTENGES